MTLLLVAIACLGHLVLMIGSHNFIYGLNLPKWASKLGHLMHLLATLALPAGLVAGWGWSLTGLLTWPPSCAVHATILAYLGVCVLAAVVLLPAVTLARSRRRSPAVVQRRELVDVAKQLGRRPAPPGLLARLPGTQIFHVELTEITLHPPRLPAALDGLTILHLSDLHFHGTPDREWFDAIVERCAAWQPDIVAITGDVVDSERHHRWIVRVLGRLRWNVAGFAILGNHDYRLDPVVIRRRLRRAGLTVLENTWTQLTVRGEPLVVVGNEAPWLLPVPDLAGCPEGPFRLCLAHTPDQIGWARRHGMDLVLAGHVHGGQIRLPVFGSMFLPSMYGRRYDAGAFEVPPSLLVVSRGLSGEHPVRYNCPPEVSLITLRKAAGANQGG